MVKVSVIVPHYNDLDGLRRCLDALDRQTMARDDFEIIVADNASPCGLAEVELTIADRATLVSQPEKGAGPARNAGVGVSHGQTLAFIDSDCVADPDWLRAGIAALSCYDLVGGHVSIFVEGARAMSDAEAFEAVFAFDFRTYIEKKGFSGAGNLFCSRLVFDTTGPFRVGMSEDLEWCHRARDAGFTLGYAAEAKVGHPARGDWQQLRAKWLRIQSETYALKPPTLANKARWLARAWAMPASIVVHAPKIWRSSALRTAAERRAAFRGLAKLRMWRLIDAHRLAFGWRR